MKISFKKFLHKNNRLLYIVKWRGIKPKNINISNKQIKRFNFKVMNLKINKIWELQQGNLNWYNKQLPDFFLQKLDSKLRWILKNIKLKKNTKIKIKFKNKQFQTGKIWIFTNICIELDHYSIYPPYNINQKVCNR